MTPQIGFFWHVHHGILLEWCHSYDERVAYIKTGKPLYEQEIRLKLFKAIGGGLPKEVVDACQAFLKAEQVRIKALQVYNDAWQAYLHGGAFQACLDANQVYTRVAQVWRKADQAYDKAISDNKAVIEALHAKECPNCPWDGHTIFEKN